MFYAIIEKRKFLFLYITYLKSSVICTLLIKLRIFNFFQVATGIDLKLPEKFKRKKKDDSCLTNIKKEQDTTYRRLEKKLFKRLFHFIKS